MMLLLVLLLLMLRVPCVVELVGAAAHLLVVGVVWTRGVALSIVMVERRTTHRRSCQRASDFQAGLEDPNQKARADPPQVDPIGVDAIFHTSVIMAVVGSSNRIRRRVTPCPGWGEVDSRTAVEADEGLLDGLGGQPQAAPWCCLLGTSSFFLVWLPKAMDGDLFPIGKISGRRGLVKDGFEILGNAAASIFFVLELVVVAGCLVVMVVAFLGVVVAAAL